MVAEAIAIAWETHLPTDVDSVEGAMMTSSHFDPPKSTIYRLKSDSFNHIDYVL
jgi:hypothetical protein